MANEVDICRQDDMAEGKPPKRPQIPAASTTQVPTVSTIHGPRRLLSSSEKLPVEPQIEGSQGPPAAVKSDKNEANHRTSENMVKAALTELLNDDNVKNNPVGNKSVQDLLMKTEREWRKLRKKSVHERGPDQNPT